MTFSANAGSPIAFGTGPTGNDDRALFLKLFSGEVLTAFTQNTIMKGKVREKTITGGKSFQFIRTGTSKAEYLARGQEMMGNPYATAEVEISVDMPTVASHSLWDLDRAMSQFDVRGPMSQEMGQALGRLFDQNCMRSVILAARTAGIVDTTTGYVFGGGTKIVDAALLTSGTIDGVAWMDAIRKAKLKLLGEKNLPPNSTIYMAVPFAVFDAIKYARDPQSGQYLNLMTIVNMAAAGLGAGVTEAIRFEGVTIFPSSLIPNTNETAAAGVFAKYRADYSKTSAIMWTVDAVAALTLIGQAVETFRDVRRQEDFLVAKQVNGHGTLRSECAVEFAVA